ncbi:hypothetical protein J4E91_008329 [Alternaria rosae]|nr:hypothetical protein J4E91_008329 [Alternaria rosae]
MSELAQKPDITVVQSDPVVDSAQSSASSPVHTEDSQSGVQMLRIEEQSPPARVEGDLATGSRADQDAPPTTSPPAREAVYNRVIKCVTYRANNLPCDDLGPCTECEQDETECIRRRCGFAAKKVGQRCEPLCDRLHNSDLQKNSEADNGKMNKRKRELEDSEAEGKGPYKALKDTVLEERTSDEEPEYYSLEEIRLAARATAERESKRLFDKIMAISKREVAARMSTQEHREDDEAKGEEVKKVKKSAIAIAYAYLADGTGTAA